MKEQNEVEVKEELLELTVKKLLEKIGKGSHKPGSGSAAALNGILSCKLLLTVIQLTLDPKRKNYKSSHEKCKNIQSLINEQINPRLEELFQEDSIQFDKAIKKRLLRDKEKNQTRKNSLDEESLEELIKSTELPIEIANLCIEIAEFSLYMFDFGFKGARGDSGVALSSSLSSISGCISIVSLNLQSFPKSDWTVKINKQKISIREKYETLIKENASRMNKLEDEARLKNEFLFEALRIKTELKGKAKLSFDMIEKLARDSQNFLWKYRELIWKNTPPENLLEVLQPGKLIETLKYSYQEVNTLGVNDLGEEIAGIIDNRNSLVTVSGMFPPETRNFTAAHELGHALMHNKLVIHRDRPLDGSEFSQPRQIIELQADKFAAYFLMPETLLREMFIEFFQVRKFKITEQNSRAIAKCSSQELRIKVKNLRGLSKLLAKTAYFNFRPFPSLSKTFNVSVEAMAIRLEELELVEF